jgi:lysophospholipase L1-like esterase
MLACLVVACGGASCATAAFPAVSQAAKKPPLYYVSLGDSYSVGFQPGLGPTSGYTGYVAKKLKMQLENFGCGGATTSSILSVLGCESPYGPPAKTDAVSYPTLTQVAAADAFIKAHPGQIGLITVSIAGNDVTACAQAANPIACVTTATTAIQTNVGLLARDLRAAAGAAVPIVGLTYPDVILGDYVYPPGGPNNTSLAQLSVTAFEALINPALKAAYGSAGGSFVDVTADTGAYTPLSQTVRLMPYGRIPYAVAQVCKLTYFCQLGNIHANDKGYKDIGKFVVADYATLPHV